MKKEKKKMEAGRKRSSQWKSMGEMRSEVAGGRKEKFRKWRCVCLDSR
jgi:hypothetical protein